MIEPWHLVVASFVMPGLTFAGVWIAVRRDRRDAKEYLIAQGRHVERVEQAASKIERIEGRLDRIPQIEQQLVFLHHKVDANDARHRSDHRALAAKHDALDRRVSETRERLASIHDHDSE